MMFASLPGAVLCAFKKGDCLIKQGDRVEYIYYVVEGTCYGTAVTANGLETIHYIKGDDRIINSLVGVLVPFVDQPSITNFIAKTDCLCYRIPTDVIMQCLSRQPDLLKELVTLAMTNYYLVCGKLQTRQQRGAAGALAQFLLDRAVLEEGQKIVPESYSNADISRFLGIHPVTAAKILKELKSQGLITRSKSGIIILDEPLLQQYADGEKKLVYRYRK